ncbi:AAA family ATPase [Streptomyces sp. SID3343]|uniref:chloramphenicol phosphotransferase CPT family protein n=1 Tax=Streptomyces sp. SID3343 TaxID=2690260 RepID=UPI001371606B|nr:AAA family ATPase [Streptomyces sp. SID3343]MYV99099.1 AAA family ATPase [Streptomyces sp. SID3343]
MPTSPSPTDRAATSSPPTRPGRIIFLNGTSSSGKSSIAAELVPLLDQPCFHMPADAFHAMRSRREIAPSELDFVLERTWMGYHRAVAGMAAAGNTVVMDHILSQEWRLPDCLSLFVPRDVVLVGLHCPLPELERREHARGNRPPGLAAKQFDTVHAHGLYDLEYDTSTTGSADCARRIKAFLDNPESPTAFERLHSGEHL